MDKSLLVGLRGKIITGIFWSFLGTIISRGFMLLAFFFIARILSVDDYGKIGILRSFINTFLLFSLGSFGVTATKYLALYKDKSKEIASQILSLTRILVGFISLLILILSIAFSSFLTDYIVGDKALESEVIISSFAIFFASLNGLQVGALAGFERFRSISIVNIVNGVISLPVLILGALHYGVKGVIIGLLIVNFSIWVCSAILLQLVVKKEQVYFTFSGLKKHLDVLKNFSIPSFLSSLMLSPTILISNSLLVKYDSSGFMELGIYNAAFNFSILCVTLIGVVGKVFYPFAMKKFSKGDKNFDFININHSYLIGILICLPILIFPDLMAQLFGEKYENSNMYFSSILVALSAIVISQRQGIARNFAAGNYMWWSLISNLVWGGGAIIFSYFLLSEGAYGRSLAFLLAYTLNTLIFIPFYFRKGLVDKSLIISKFNLMLIFYISIAILSFLYIDSILMRSLIFIILFSLTIITFFKWWKNFTK